MTGSDSFLAGDALAEVVAVIVTYNSADDLPVVLSGLRAAARAIDLRVVVVDNGSTDGTLDVLDRADDIIVVSGHGNVGYAGGINAALTRVGATKSVLVLNPDLALDPECVRLLLAALQTSGAGVVVPRIVDEQGATYPSLRREPTVLRALGDALVGRRLVRRPPWLSEIDHRAASYRGPHDVDWATGAAMLIRADVADKVGRWQELFFLYSEETDFFRRAREAGYRVRYEPSAVVHHRGGGSGTSADLDALMAVNRIRYARLHRSWPAAGAFHAVVALAELTRAYQPVHRRTLGIVLRPSRWTSLPQARPAVPLPTAGETARMIGSVVIPAHNEAAVLARTLAPLSAAAVAGVLEVIVVCNGCTDDSAAVAAAVAGIRVVETQVPSKPAALTAGDAAATVWPRLYLDADIRIDLACAVEVLDRLAVGDLLAARPIAVYDTKGASWAVRSYYRARTRVDSLHRSLWGAGVYGLSEQGRRRFGEFPTLTADDLFVDSQYRDGEKAVLAMATPALVTVPRTSASLALVLRRVQRGKREVLHDQVPGTGQARNTSSSTLRGVLAAVRGPLSAVDALVYAAFSIAARGHRGNPAQRWERDTTSRVGAGAPDG